MPSIVDRVKQRIAATRERRPLLDHAVRTVEHYTRVKGNIQAGAVTYFAFISFFPILALAFAVIGFVARVYDGAESDLIDAVNSVLPGLVGEGEGQISLHDIRDSAPGILSVGIVVVLYSGLGWLSSMRDALIVMFELPQREHPNFFIGKVRDLIALTLLGVVLIVSVGISGVVRGLSEQILDWMGLGSDLGWLLGLLAVVIGLAANALLFFALFRILAHPDLPPRALWSGAILGAVGFEVLKQISQLLLQSTASSPAFQAFGIALILVVWIYYFSRVVMYAASWAYVHPASRALRPEGVATVEGPPSPPLPWRERLAADRETESVATRWAVPFAAGSAATLALVALLRRTGNKNPQERNR
ncbi:YihY/virulence factor BrkB family protein [Nocardioides bizhenqiangii]|uniref:YihY/virulence factor BrkB family protein n=1 Tax=Nocardioides bizhenqiangii TaxID=3095076 RepID=A0ABZ0ZMV4_9ACTN|nr:YihY/virulence factor BrkB family protein [Nocardioides sp. HM61]WQQ25647.1 YihY/virulence factor BrkB family protein [Nocardioides sp. HM61]